MKLQGQEGPRVAGSSNTALNRNVARLLSRLFLLLTYIFLCYRRDKSRATITTPREMYAALNY